MLKRRKYGLVALLLVVALVFATACSGGGDKDSGDKGNDDANANAGKTYEWKIQSAYGPGDQTWDICLPMITEAITKATDGQITFKLFQPDAICSAEQEPESVKQGVLDAALSAGADMATLVPAAMAELGIPYYWEDGKDMFQNYYDYGLLDFLRAEYDKQGMFYATPVPQGIYSLMTKFKVESAADLKGKKIRGYGSWGIFVQKLGGTPVTMPGGEIQQGLIKNQLDGCIYSFAELKNAKLSEAVTYVMDQPASGSSFVNMVINKAKWEEIGPDLQEKVLQAIKDCYEPVREACIAYDTEARTYSEGEGVQFVKVSDANMPGFWDAGEATALEVEKEYPAAKPGLDLVRAWHKAVKE
jgi:TRAP-type C4-dicarboxylate transport system substrate-binding protein